MKTTEIKSLVDKFLSGETTLDEEKTLREVFLKDDFPPEFQSVALIFRYIEWEKSQRRPDAAFHAHMEKVFAREETPAQPKIYLRKQWILAMAAVVLIALTVSIFAIKRQRRPILDSMQSNPRELYQKTQKALLSLSGHYNKGLDKIRPFHKYSTAEKSLNNNSGKDPVD